MKIYRYHIRNVFILITACFLFVSRSAVSQATTSDAQSRRDAFAGFAFARSATDPARLIIRRIPNLGNNVIVELRIDGGPITSLGYGRTYKGFLRPGPHVLSVRAAPRAKWLTPWQMTLDARSGHIYSFTATGDHSGNLVLAED